MNLILDHFGNMSGKKKQTFSHFVALSLGQPRKLQKGFSKLHAK